MGLDLKVAKTLNIQEVAQVILENQEILSKDVYEGYKAMPGVTEEILRELTTKDVNEAKEHIAPLFETAKLAKFDPEKIIVYRFGGQPYCGVYDKETETIFAERTIVGCDHVSANYIDHFHRGKVDMRNNEFSNLLSNLMSRARLRVYLGKE
jgi:hypothetical protein